MTVSLQRLCCCFSLAQTGLDWFALSLCWPLADRKSEICACPSVWAHKQNHSSVAAPGEVIKMPSLPFFCWAPLRTLCCVDQLHMFSQEAPSRPPPASRQTLPYAALSLLPFVFWKTRRWEAFCLPHKMSHRWFLGRPQLSPPQPGRPASRWDANTLSAKSRQLGHSLCDHSLFTLVLSSF